MINGNIKFFDKNKINQNATITLPNNTIGDSSFLWDRDLKKTITSFGYNSDSSNFDIIIDFGINTTFDRIYMAGINAISGSIAYWDGAQFVVLATLATNTGVVYYEVNTTTTTKIRIRFTSTLIANSEKKISELIVSTELGMLEKNPTSNDLSIVAEDKILKLSNGKQNVVRFGTYFKGKLELKNATSNDMDLIFYLYNRVDPFYIWLCGGIGRENTFYKLSDLYFVNIIGEIAPKLKGNLFSLGEELKMEIAEA